MKTKKNVNKTSDQDASDARNATRKSLDTLIRNAIRFKGSQEFAELVQRIAAFSHYSSYNLILVYTQNPEVKYFGTEIFWKKRFDREVMHPCQGYIILQPNGPVAVVYDVQNTFGRERPDEFIYRQRGKLEGVRGAFQPEQFYALGEKLFRYHISVSDHTAYDIQTWNALRYLQPGGGMMKANEDGRIFTRNGHDFEIDLRHDLPIASKYTSTLHELSHLLLGHLGAVTLKDRKHTEKIKIECRKTLNSATMELEAESLSYIMAKKAGLETPSAEYLAFYLNNETVLDEFSLINIAEAKKKMEKMIEQ